MSLCPPLDEDDHPGEQVPTRSKAISIPAFFLFFSFSTTLVGASPIISIYKNAPIPVRHAAQRMVSGRDRSIRIELNSDQNPNIGAQGYMVRSTNGGAVAIRANTAEGMTNGVYTFLRTLMIERRKDPFSRQWHVDERPQFSIREMLVSPYRFGASYGFAALSPDRWTLADWKEYVDFMRLCNMTTLVMGSHRVYDPDYPQSEREKWRYEVWKQVMDYCHRVGMKFHWYMNPNLVTQQAFWEHPDLRANQEAGAWNGNGLMWSKGKDFILKTQRYTLNYFRGLDGLELIYTDGGGLSFDDETGANPTAYFADATRSYISLMKETGNNGQFVFWNWIMDVWSKVLLPEATLEKYPKYRTIQDDIIPLLPKNVAWLDTSLLTVIQDGAAAIQARGNPPLREGILIGKEHGFRPVIDLFWYMNPEFSINMFPDPFIRRGIQEAQYARDEVSVDGVMGYRLAPPCKFIDDYVFFRLASDPFLTQEQLVNELAGLLAEKPESQHLVKEAINTLENFWTTHRLEDIERAGKLFREVLPAEKSKHLQYVSDGVTFLTSVVRMAQPAFPPEQKNQLRKELYDTVKCMYIFQGLTSDIVWTPEALRFFNARVDMMVEDYNSPIIAGSPYPEVVDRGIYPQATSKPFKLQWPAASGTKP